MGLKSTKSQKGEDPPKAKMRDLVRHENGKKAVKDANKILKRAQMSRRGCLDVHRWRKFAREESRWIEKHGYAEQIAAWIRTAERHDPAMEGCKVSKDKVQIAKDKVVFLGHCISSQLKHITTERKAAIANAAEPSGPGALRAFLGLVSYCREWIPSASMLMQPLFNVLASCNKGIPFLLTEAAREGFHKLKLTIMSAPALGIPNYELHCYETAGHAKGVLTQRHGEKPRPVGYYSAQLDAVMRGAPSCVRAVAACAILKDKVADIVLDHNLVIQVPHAVQELLAQATTKHLSIARLTKYEVSLLTSPNVVVKRCTTLNPATLLPDSDIQSAGEEHDCVSLMKGESKMLDNVIETPILNPDAEYYVDGSRFYQDGKPYTGYAVVGPSGTLKGEALPAGMSAQEAELVALTEAC
ncbi:genomic stop codons [Pristimantis euphronides]